MVHGDLSLAGCLLESDVTYVGFNIPRSDKEVENQQACAELCASTSGGLFWTYIVSQKRCFVKSSDSDRRDKNGRVSGNRDCGLGKTLSVRNDTFVVLYFQNIQ